MTLTALLSTVIGTIIGVVISALAQWIARKRRDFLAARALRADIALIYRHIEASASSLGRLGVNAPVHLVKARLRYSMFAQSPLSYTQLDFIERSGRADEMRILLTLMRNSDIFLEEVAEAFGDLSAEDRQGAMRSAIENIESLRDFLDKLGLRELARTAKVSSALAAEVEKSRSERTKVTEDLPVEGVATSKTVVKSV